MRVESKWRLADSKSKPDQINSLFIHLGLDNLDSLSDSEFCSRLSVVSVAWPRDSSGSHTCASPISLDDRFCVSLLDRMDEIMEKFIKANNCQIEEIKSNGAATNNPINTGADSELAISSVPSSDEVLSVLRFSGLLISYCWKPAVYNSCDRLVLLLNVDQFDLVVAALTVLQCYQHTAARFVSFTAFHSRFQFKIRPFLLFLASSFFVPQPPQPSSSSVRNLSPPGPGSDLIELSLDRSAEEFSFAAEKFHFAFTSNFGFAALSQIQIPPVANVEIPLPQPPTAPIPLETPVRRSRNSRRSRSISPPSKSPKKKSKSSNQPTNTGIAQNQSSNSNSLAFSPPPFTPTSSGISGAFSIPSSHSNSAVLSLAEIHSLWNSLQSHKFRCVMDLVRYLSVRYQIPQDQQFSLAFLIRFSLNHESIRVRRQIVKIRLVAIQTLLTFSSMRRELVHFLRRSDDLVLDGLIHIIRSSLPIPTEIRAATMRTLTALAIVSSIRTELKSLGLMQNGVILMLLRQSINSFTSNIRSLTGSESAAEIDSIASQSSYTETMLGFVERMLPKAIFTETSAINEVEALELMLNCLADESFCYAPLLTRALNILDTILMQSNSSVIAKFHSAHGIDICIQRIQQIIEYREIFSDSPVTQFKPLLMIAPQHDHAPTVTKKYFIPVTFLASKAILMNLFTVLVTSIRHHRQVIKSASLKDSSLARMIISLWNSAINKETAEPAVSKSDDENDERRKKIRLSASESSFEVSSSSSASSSSPVALSNSSSFHWGDEIFSMSCTFLCSIISNHPAILKSLHADGITNSFLSLISSDVLHSVSLIRVIPETLRSLSLIPSGLAEIRRFNPFRPLFSVFLSQSSADVVMLDKSLIMFLGRSLEELFRHNKELLPIGMDSLVELIRMAISQAESIESGSPRLVGGRLVESENFAAFSRRLTNLSRLMENLVKHFPSEFLKANGAQAIIEISNLRNRSPTLSGVKLIRDGKFDSSTPAELIPSASLTSTLSSSASVSAAAVATAASAVALTVDSKDRKADAKEEDNAIEKANNVCFMSMISPVLILAIRDPDSVMKLLIDSLNTGLNEIVESERFNSNRWLMNQNDEFFDKEICQLGAIDWCSHALSRLSRHVPPSHFATKLFRTAFQKLIILQHRLSWIMAWEFAAATIEQRNQETISPISDPNNENPNGAANPQAASSSPASSSFPTISSIAYQSAARCIYHTVKLIQASIKLAKPGDLIKQTPGQAQIMAELVSSNFLIFFSLRPDTAIPSGKPQQFHLLSLLKYLKGALRCIRTSLFSGSQNELNAELFTAIRQRGGGQKILQIARWTMRKRVSVAEEWNNKPASEAAELIAEAIFKSLIIHFDDCLVELGLMADHLSRYETLPEKDLNSSLSMKPSAAAAARRSEQPQLPETRIVQGILNSASSAVSADANSSSPTAISAAASASLSASAAHVVYHDGADNSLYSYNEANDENPTAATGSNSPSIRPSRPSNSHRQANNLPFLPPLPPYSPPTTSTTVSLGSIESFELTSADRVEYLDSTSIAEYEVSNPVIDTGIDKFTQLIAEECWRPISNQPPIFHKLQYLPPHFVTCIINLTHRILLKARKEELKSKQAAEEKEKEKSTEQVKKPESEKPAESSRPADSRHESIIVSIVDAGFPRRAVEFAMIATRSTSPEMIIEYLLTHPIGIQQSQNRTQTIENNQSSSSPSPSDSSSRPAASTISVVRALFGDSDCRAAVAEPILNSLARLSPATLVHLQPLFPSPFAPDAAPVLTAMLSSIANLFVLFNFIQTDSNDSSNPFDEKFHFANRQAMISLLANCFSKSCEESNNSLAAIPVTRSILPSEILHQQTLFQRSHSFIYISSVICNTDRKAGTAPATRELFSLALSQTQKLSKFSERIKMQEEKEKKSNEGKNMEIEQQSTTAAAEKNKKSEESKQEQSQSHSLVHSPPSSASADKEKLQLESYLCTLLYYFNLLLDVQTSTFISDREILNCLVGHEKDRDREKAMNSPMIMRDLAKQQELLDLLTDLLPMKISHSRALPSLFQILARLTRFRPFVDRFCYRRGFHSLINIPSPSPPAFDPIKPTAPQPSDLLFDTSLHILLRHLIIGPNSLQESMQEEILIIMGDYENQISAGLSRAQKKLVGHKKSLGLNQFIFLFAALIRRDPAAFIRAVQVTCELEKIQYEQAPASTENVKIQIRLKRSAETEKSKSDKSSKEEKSENAEIKEKEKEKEKPKETEKSAKKDRKEREKRNRSRSRSRSRDPRASSGLHRNDENIPAFNAPLSVEASEKIAEENIKLSLESVVIDLFRADQRRWKWIAEEQGKLEKIQVPTMQRATSVSSAPAAPTARPSKSSRKSRQNAAERVSSSFAGSVDPARHEKFQRRLDSLLDSDPVSPLDPSFHPLLNHVTVFQSLVNQLDFHPALFYAIKKFDPRRTSGILCAFPSILSLCSHFLILDGLAQFCSTASICEFLLQLANCFAALKSESDKKKSQGETAKKEEKETNASKDNEESELEATKRNNPTAAAAPASEAAKNKDKDRLGEDSDSNDFIHSLIAQLTSILFQIISTGIPTTTPIVKPANNQVNANNSAPSNSNSTAVVTESDRVLLPAYRPYRVPTHGSNILRQVTQHKQYWNSIEFESLKSLFKPALVSVIGLCNMMAAILSKNADGSATSQTFKRLCCKQMIECQTHSVLTGVLHWIEFLNGNRLAITAIAAATKLLSTLVAEDSRHNLRNSEFWNSATAKQKKKNRRENNEIVLVEAGNGDFHIIDGGRRRNRNSASEQQRAAAEDEDDGAVDRAFLEAIGELDENDEFDEMPADGEMMIQELDDEGNPVEEERPLDQQLDEENEMGIELDPSQIDEIIDDADNEDDENDDGDDEGEGDENSELEDDEQEEEEEDMDEDEDEDEDDGSESDLSDSLSDDESDSDDYSSDSGSGEYDDFFGPFDSDEDLFGDEMSNSGSSPDEEMMENDEENPDEMDDENPSENNEENENEESNSEDEEESDENDDFDQNDEFELEEEENDESDEGEMFDRSFDETLVSRMFRSPNASDFQFLMESEAPDVLDIGRSAAQPSRRQQIAFSLAPSVSAAAAGIGRARRPTGTVSQLLAGGQNSSAGIASIAGLARQSGNNWQASNSIANAPPNQLSSAARHNTAPRSRQLDELIDEESLIRDSSAIDGSVSSRPLVPAVLTIRSGPLGQFRPEDFDQLVSSLRNYQGSGEIAIQMPNMPRFSSLIDSARFIIRGDDSAQPPPVDGEVSLVDASGSIQMQMHGSSSIQFGSDDEPISHANGGAGADGEDEDFGSLFHRSRFYQNHSNSHARQRNRLIQAEKSLQSANKDGGIGLRTSLTHLFKEELDMRWSEFDPAVALENETVNAIQEILTKLIARAAIIHVQTKKTNEKEKTNENESSNPPEAKKINTAEEENKKANENQPIIQSTTSSSSVAAASPVPVSAPVDSSPSVPPLVSESSVVEDDDAAELRRAMELSIEVNQANNSPAEQSNPPAIQAAAAVPVSAISSDNPVSMEISSVANSNPAPQPTSSIPAVSSSSAVPPSDNAHGFDPEVLNSLPSDLRAEVLLTEFAARGFNSQPRSSASRNNAAVDSSLNPEFLAALPEEIRAELLAQERSQRAAIGRIGDSSANNELDTASLIMTMDDQAREEFLLNQEEKFLFQQDPHILAEALSLRQRMSRSSAHRMRQSARRDMLNDSASAAQPSNESAIQPNEEAKAQPQADANNIENKSEDNMDEVVEVSTSSLVPPLSSNSSVPYSSLSSLRSLIENSDQTGHSLLSSSSLVPLLRLFYISSLSDSVLNSLSRLLEHLISFAETRETFMNLLLAILRNTNISNERDLSNSTQPEIIQMLAALPRQLIGQPEESNLLIDSINSNSAESISISPPLVIGRVLDFLHLLATKRPWALAVFFFSNRKPQTSNAVAAEATRASNTKSSTKKRKNRKANSNPPVVSVVSVDNSSPIIELLHLLASPAVTSSRELGFGVVRLLSDIADFPLKLVATMKSERARAEKRKSANSQENEELNKLTAIPDIWHRVAVEFPDFPQSAIRPLLSIVDQDGFTDKALEYLFKTILVFGSKPSIRDSFIRELVKLIQELNIQLSSDLQSMVVQNNQIPSANNENARKRKRDREGSPTPATNNSVATSNSAAAILSLATRESTLLRYLRILNSLQLIDSAVSTSSPSAIRTPTAATPFPMLVEPTPTRGRQLLSSLGLWDSLNSLWLSLDEFFSRCERIGSKSLIEEFNDENEPTGEESKEREEKVSISDSDRRRKLDDRRQDLTEESDTETRESDIQLLVHLPLLESFFICNAGKSRSAIDFNEFCSSHRRALNVCCRQNPGLIKSSSGPFHILLRHPNRILDFDIRRKYFKSELRKLSGKARATTGVKLHIRRDRIFEDSYAQIRLHSIEELKGKLSIKFYGEEGLDVGGLSREWFLLLSRSIFNPNYALFRAAADNPAVFQPNKDSFWNPDHLSYFRFVGRFVGKSLFDSQRLDAYFTRSFYKHILGLAVNVSDMESIDPEYYKTLKWMMDNSINGALDDLTFSAEFEQFGESEIIDLVPNGRNLPVTDQNKDEYIRLISDFILSRSIRKQVDAFLAGFHELIPQSLIAIFNENELELMISGLPNIDLDDLKANTEYRGSFNSDSQTIQWFWQILSEFDQQEKALLLLFVTGTSKVPLDGFKALQGTNGIMKFTIQSMEKKDCLMQSHTCFNMLDLPEYSNIEIMREKVLTALREGSQGFGFR